MLTWDRDRDRALLLPISRDDRLERLLLDSTLFVAYREQFDDGGDPFRRREPKFLPDQAKVTLV